MTLKIIRPKQITGIDFLTAIGFGICLGLDIYWEQENRTNDSTTKKNPKNKM